MVDDRNDILSEIESLKRDMRRIAVAITITGADLDQTQGRFEKSTVGSWQPQQESRHSKSRCRGTKNTCELDSAHKSQQGRKLPRGAYHNIWK